MSGGYAQCIGIARLGLVKRCTVWMCPTIVTRSKASTVCVVSSGWFENDFGARIKCDDEDQSRTMYRRRKIVNWKA